MTAYAHESEDESGAVVRGGGEGSCAAGSAPASGASMAVASARRWPAFDAVVLAGGAATRLGGADKPGVSVGGRSLLDRVLAACAGARSTVVVGGRRPTVRPVVWVREEPPGGGPLAALNAGLRRTTADRVAVLSADLPFLGEQTVRRLLTALDGPESEAGGADAADRAAGDSGQAGQGHAHAGGGHVHGDVSGGDVSGGAGAEVDGTGSGGSGGGGDGLVGGGRGTGTSGGRDEDTRGSCAGTRGGVPGVVRHVEGVMLVDRDGRDQPLVAAYEGEALRREIALLAAEHGGLTGLPLRLLTGELAVTRISDPVASFDCDTWDDIAAARSRIREHGHVFDEWMTAVKDELGVDIDVATGALLDLTRDVAHGVARPAAPLTCFLVGYAAAQHGGGPEAVAEATRKAAALVARWASEDQPEKPDAG